MTDFDNDGITDSSDACVEIPRGATDNNGDGCPDRPAKLSDTDGDEVPDNFDACPTVAASTEDGCPPDTTAPTVTRWTPTGKKVSSGANAVAFFSEDMNGPTVEAPGTFTLKKKGSTKALGAMVTYVETTTTTGTTYKAVLNPTNRLRAGTTYIATVSSAATDVAGNPLDQNPSLAGNQPKTWRFTVKP